MILSERWGSEKERPRTKPAEQRREELMDAAQRLFLEKGFSATTIDHVTTRAAVAKGTFYLYFHSKEDVLNALRERFIDDYVGGIDGAVAKHRRGDWPGMLSTWVQAAIEGHLAAVALHEVVFQDLPRKSEEYAGTHRVIRHLAHLLDAGTAAEAWSLDDPEFAALFLFHALHGTIHDTLTSSRRVNRRRLVRNMQWLFRRVVGLAGS